MYVSLSLTLSGVCVEVPSNLDIASICLVMSDDSQISRRNIHTTLVGFLHTSSVPCAGGRRSQPAVLVRTQKRDRIANKEQLSRFGSQESKMFSID